MTRVRVLVGAVCRVRWRCGVRPSCGRGRGGSSCFGMEVDDGRAQRPPTWKHFWEQARSSSVIVFVRNSLIQSAKQRSDNFTCVVILRGEEKAEGGGGGYRRCVCRGGGVVDGCGGRYILGMTYKSLICTSTSSCCWSCWDNWGIPSMVRGEQTRAGGDGAPEGGFRGWYS